MYNWYNGMNPDITNFVVSLIIKTVVIVARFSDIVRKEVEQVLDYISVTGPVTRFWHPKHEALRISYRFAIGREHVTESSRRR